MSLLPSYCLLRAQAGVLVPRKMMDCSLGLYKAASLDTGYFTLNHLGTCMLGLHASLIRSRMGQPGRVSLGVWVSEETVFPLT